MPTTPGRLALPYPAESDVVADGALAMRLLAEAVDNLLSVGTQTALAFRAGYQSYNAQHPCTTLRIGRLVVAQGLVGPTSGANFAAGSNVTVADLPAACRPSQDLYLPAATSAAAGEARLLVFADGTVRMNTELAVAYVSFSAVWVTA